MSKNALLALALLTASLLPALSERAQASPSETLCTSARKPGQVDHVTITLELSGERKEQGPKDAKDPARAAISVHCELQYDEKTLAVAAGDGPRWRSVRHYDKAETRLKIGAEELTPKLRGDRNPVVVIAEPPRVSVFSARGPLTSDEIEILENIGDSLLTDELLPAAAVKAGDTWKPSDKLLAAFLNLDAITSNTVEIAVKEVTDAVVRFEITGKAAGRKNDVTSRVELKGKYRFDLRLGRIDWVGLLVSEQRGIGAVEAGFDVVSRCQMRILPEEKCEALSDEALKGVSLEPSEGSMQLVYQSPDNTFELLHDRSWYVTGSHRDVATLRRIDQGEYVAQCVVSPMPTRSVEQLPALDQFQDDVRKALDKRFGEFLSAGESANARKYRVLHVAVQGKVEDSVMRWFYFHVADQQGRQAVLAFTVDDRLAERLEGADAKLADGLRFVDDKAAKTE